MKKTNFTIHEGITTKLTTLLVMLLFMSFTGTNLNAQANCALICNANTNVSLDEDGEALITVAMVADTSECMDGVFEIILEELDGTPVANPVTCEFLHKTLVVRVRDMVSNNYAWGNLTIEDYLKPIVDCPVDPIEVNCITMPQPEDMAAFLADLDIVSDNCTPAEELVIDITSETTILNEGAGCLSDPDLVKTITRTLRTVDKSGNVSDECTITFIVTTIASASADMLVTEIPNLGSWLDGTANGPVPCTHPDVEKGVIPPVSVTGVPVFVDEDGVETPIYPSTANSCLIVTKEDEKLASAGPGHCVDKYMRTFTVYEWSVCGNSLPIRTITQMIDVSDEEGPVITDKVEDFIASTTNHECSGMVYMDPITAIDACSDTDKITITYPGGPVLESNGGWIELPIGVNQVIYKAYDKCHRLTADTVLVTVEDLTPPVAICNQNTAVGLTNDGYAHVAATVFDDGSYDECNLSTMLVRRMNPNEDCEPCAAPVFSHFTSLGKFNGHYYYLSHNELSGRLARKHAVAMGGYGVSLETAAERTWLEGEIPANADYYVGLNTNGGSNYTWASGANLSSSVTNSGDDLDDMEYVSYDQATQGWIGSDGTVERRYVIEIAQECWYSEYTAFCCNDIGAQGDSNMVVFRVIDAACNFNECMVDVDVQDKIGPIVTCPDDVTVLCEDPLTVDDLLAYGEDMQVFDNCGFTTTHTIDTVKVLCDYVYTVNYTVTDDGGRSTTCDQVIRHDYSQDIERDDFNTLAIADRDYSDGCENPDPADYGIGRAGTLGFPEGVCNQLAMNISDEVFYFGQEQSGTCFKILRTFRVINWCELNDGITPEYGPEGTNEVYTFVQTIKVSSDIAPTLNCEDKLTFDSDADNCLSGTVSLTQSAVDNCESGNAMTYSYSVDGGARVFGTGTDVTVEGTYSVGEHNIEWTFTNACGNSRTCTQEFEVLSTVAPTPYCLSNIAMPLMEAVVDGETVGIIDIWASDFDLGTTHPCDNYTIKPSFSTDPDDDVRFFDCDDVEEVQELTVYYTSVNPDGEYVVNSNGDFVQQFCTVYADIQVGTSDVCGDIMRPVIEGHIATIHADVLNDVRVNLRGGEIASEMTTEGAYAFPEMPIGGDYVVEPTKNDDVNNGVSTLDLVLIQRHVVGLQDLIGAHNLVAADINNDEMISAIDIVDLRKVILGVNDSFTGNESWRFVDANFTFSDATNPWATTIPESYDINNLNQDMIVDFTAIKVGDVNNSVDLANAVSTSTEVRSSDVLSMIADITNTTDGQVSSIPVYAETTVNLSGAQMTINLGNEVTFAAIESGAINIADQNIGLRFVDRGIVTLSWDNTNGVNINKGDVLFNIVVEATTYDNNTLAVTSDITKAEAFNTNYEVMNVELAVRNNVSNGFALMQNTPNPFNDFTNISFNLPKAMNATITVYDVNGRTLKTISSTYDQGNNTIRLEKSELGASGILYYQLQAGDFTANRKMVLFN